MEGTNKELSLQEEARSQTTSPERLKELACHEYKAVRKAVTSNPNTPTETLLKLGKYFPQELLSNPIFEFLCLENSKFVEEISLNTLSVLLEQNNTPKFLLRYAANHQDEEIRQVAKMHIVISGEINKGWHELATSKIY